MGGAGHEGREGGEGDYKDSKQENHKCLPHICIRDGLELVWEVKMAACPWGKGKDNRQLNIRLLQIL